mmetsp:Transcript_29067/g.63254  ORF Transcript_29067/g.63254 Transcript_29067/m.63254 type:complete len:203 (+) Transcript_29067:241-849(+)
MDFVRDLKLAGKDDALRLEWRRGSAARKVLCTCSCRSSSSSESQGSDAALQAAKLVMLCHAGNPCVLEAHGASNSELSEGKQVQSSVASSLHGECGLDSLKASAEVSAVVWRLQMSWLSALSWLMAFLATSAIANSASASSSFGRGRAEIAGWNCTSSSEWAKVQLSGLSHTPVEAKDRHIFVQWRFGRGLSSSASCAKPQA